VKAIPEAAVLIMEPELKPGMVLSALVFSVLVIPAMRLSTESALLSLALPKTQALKTSFQ
jgi:hypothetical protein